MRNLKKVLSVLLVVAMLATSMVTAFAADTISADAKICADIGMLIGAGDGVTSEYTATTPSRIQAAVMLLRLKGKAADAAKFEGKENFADVEGDEWFAPYTAYLKANSDIGFVGVEDGKFAAEEKITAQQYYKVVLTALGYEVGEGKDYKYEDTITFAASKGLKKVAEATEFTVNDVAIATVEGLIAPVKGGTKTLATVLVEAKVLDAAKATAAGIYSPYTALAVSGVSAYTNTKVKVTLSTAATIVDKAKFSIVDVAGTALEVKGATLSADGKTVTVETAVQTAYQGYKLTVDGVTKSFVGLPADSTKPSITVNSTTDYNKMTLTFNVELDPATATNIANYSSDNSLSILKADYDNSTKVVTLTTSEQTVGLVYNVTVQNVASPYGIVMDKVTKVFGAMGKDTSKPAISTVTSTDYNKVSVVFDKKVDSATATNIANYTADNNMTIIAASIDTADTTGKTVTLTTSEQTVGAVYNLTVQNVASVYGVVMDKATSMFGGMAKNLSKPSILTVTSTDYNKVEVKFDAAVVKVDKAAATNAANYTCDNNLVITAAALADDGVTVTLTTSEQTVGAVYSLTVQNVTSVNSVAMDKVTKLFGGTAKDTAAPTITAITSTTNTVTIVFNKSLDKAKSSDLLDYVFDGSLGYAIRIAFTKTNFDNDTVTLTTANQTAGKIYNVTINNIADAKGNVIAANSKKSFVGSYTAAAAKVNLQAAVIVDKNSFKLIFDADAGAAATVGVTVYQGSTLIVPTPVIVQLDDKKTYLVQYAAEQFIAPNLYTVTATAANLNVADNANVKTFAGTTVADAKPYAMAVVPVNTTAIKVIFSEKVTSVDNADFTISSSAGSFNPTSVSASSGTEITLYLPTAISSGPVYTLTVVGTINDLAGLVAVDTVSTTTKKVTFTGTTLVNAAPKMATAIVTDMYNVEVIFSEAVTADTNLNNYVISKVSGPQTVIPSVVDATYDVSDNTKLKLRFDSTKAGFEAGNVYKITYNAAITVDAQGLTYDTTAKEVTFAGTNVVNAKPSIAGVVATAADNKIVITMTETLYNGGVAATTATFVVNLGSDVTYTATSTDGKVFTLTAADFDALKIGTVKFSAGAVDVNNQAPVADAASFGTK